MLLFKIVEHWAQIRFVLAWLTEEDWGLLVNVLGKLPKDLFSAFDETDVLEGANTGDVKYHLGFSSNIDTPGGEVHVSLIHPI